MSKPVCVVFGATGGIGSEVCRQLSHDFRLVLVARDETRLAELAAETGGLTVSADVCDFTAVEEVFDKARELGEVRAAINCVGSILLKPGHLTSESDFMRTIELNLKSAFAVCRASAKSMMRGGGSVVLFSSAAAEAGLANHEAIAAAKAGVNGLTRASAASYASKGIRFNAVAPGLVDTPLAERITSNPRSLEASEKMHPLGRIGRPQEVARLACWLLKEEQGWITGQVIGIDGGLATVKGR